VLRYIDRVDISSVEISIARYSPVRNIDTVRIESVMKIINLILSPLYSLKRRVMENFLWFRVLM